MKLYVLSVLFVESMNQDIKTDREKLTHNKEQSSEWG